MPLIRVTKSTTLLTSPANTRHIHKLVLDHGGLYRRNFKRGLPYIDTSIRKHASCPNHDLPNDILERVRLVESKSTGDATRRNDESRVRAYLDFCTGLGIRVENAIPASYDLVAAWASSFAGRFCSNTVGAKISALKKLHVRLGYEWSAGDLRGILKGIEEM
jgi:hypothetical protein